MQGKGQLGLSPWERRPCARLTHLLTLPMLECKDRRPRLAQSLAQLTSPPNTCGRRASSRKAAGHQLGRLHVCVAVFCLESDDTIQNVNSVNPLFGYGCHSNRTAGSNSMWTTWSTHPKTEQYLSDLHTTCALILYRGVAVTEGRQSTSFFNSIDNHSSAGTQELPVGAHSTT